MSWKRNDREERGYHHGNLREALIQAARELIKEKGPAGFTFADAARSAGVSPAAPYRHFRDRDALMADVAREGFERFEAMLATGWASGKPDPDHRLPQYRQGLPRLRPRRARLLRRHVRDRACRPISIADLRAASDRAFGVLRTRRRSCWWPCCRPASARPP